MTESEIITEYLKQQGLDPSDEAIRISVKTTIGFREFLFNICANEVRKISKMFEDYSSNGNASRSMSSW